MKTANISRRDFLRLAGMAATATVATAAQAALAPEATAATPTVQGGVAAPQWESKFGVCDMCFNRCGLIARVEKGVIKKLDPNPAFTKSRGMLCARGNAGVDQVYDPERLKTPLLRTGKRGEGKWKEIGWDEALELCAAKMKDIAAKHTRCGMLFSAGADTQSQFVNRFAEAFGSYNVTSHESLCLLSGNRAFVDTFGEVPLPDVKNSKYVILAGANRMEALVTPDSMDLMAIMGQGAKVVVLDPRYTKSAALASEWHAIRPGTDMAFMLALAHVIINEKLYDPKFVAERTSGLDKLAAHVAELTPQWAEGQTGIPAASIARIARELAAAAPAAMVYPGRRSSDYENSTQIRRSFAIVNALLGNWDRPGGLVPPRPAGLKKVPFEPPFYDDNPPGRVDMKSVPLLFDDEGSFVLTREAVIKGAPYPVKGWFVYKTNPMATAPDRKKTREMIEALDFMVVADIAMSDTAWMADLVLPMPSALERQDPVQALQAGAEGACLVWRDPVIAPLYQSRPVFEVLKALSARLGFPEAFDFDIPKYREMQLAAFPEAAEILKRDGVFYPPNPPLGTTDGQPFKTPSQKIELYSNRYADMGLEPLPAYQPPRQSPDAARTFRLVAGRSACVTQASSTNNALLSEFEPVNTLWLNEASAKELGVAQGDLVLVESPAGKGELRALVTPKIRKDTVYMLSGFGTISGQLKHSRAGASIVELMESRFDAICGNSAIHETFVSVKKKGAA
ncbi:MAG TPA: molybdopterin-dependent oxidoreductase [Humidesulfovibrio sp.]|uniref:molybdopterin-containing oxidoreductase family protein n=1 Tax=Humidesulfovibrio sp. TaxID=2910988 RepID=UPI002BDB9D4C|nr:molybdopterin-dependent oxidoreductase [Humidesulfovibrio sp.]HWR03490.1 molybdopterin-dependent oxidoreductase [Humidesulfovibrio sp.]